MVRFIFKIVFVERGPEALWRGWITIAGGATRYSPSAGDRDLLGRYELIEAHDIEEAVEITQRRFPDCTVMREGSERICSA